MRFDFGSGFWIRHNGDGGSDDGGGGSDMFSVSFSRTKSYPFAIQFSMLYWFYMLIICAVCVRRICVRCHFGPLSQRGNTNTTISFESFVNEMLPVRFTRCVCCSFSSTRSAFLSPHLVRFRWWYSFLLFSIQIYTKTINTDGQYKWMRKSLFVLFVCQINTNRWVPSTNRCRMKNTFLLLPIHTRTHSVSPDFFFFMGKEWNFTLRFLRSLCSVACSFHQILLKGFYLSIGSREITWKSNRLQIYK